jgi:HK97 family phage prohead protease
MTHVPPVIDGEIEARSASLTNIEIRDAGEGKVTLAGYAAVFDSPSEDMGGWIEIIKRGAFRKALNSNPDVRFLINHEGLPLGRTKNKTLRLEEDAKGLRFEVDLDDTRDARDLVAKVKRGDVDQMSFRFRLIPAGREWVYPEGEDEPAQRVITEFREILEVSIVTFAAYPATEVGVRSMIAGEPIADQAGHLQRDLFDAVCERVHTGDLDASRADRRELERAAERLKTVTPWQRERALQASGGEPEGNGDAVDPPEGKRGDEQPGDQGVPVDVLRRRLDAQEREFAFERSMTNTH